MSELVTDAGQERWGTVRKSTSKSARYRRCQGQWWRAESPAKAKGTPWTGNRHQAGENKKTNQEPSSNLASMMKTLLQVAMNTAMQKLHKSQKLDLMRNLLYKAMATRPCPELMNHWYAGTLLTPSPSGPSCFAIFLWTATLLTQRLI